jgi:hypothetical protein
MENALRPLGLDKGELADRVTSTLTDGGEKDFYIDRLHVSVQGGGVKVEPIDPKYPQ